MLANVRGTRDLLPELAKRKKEIIETCRYFFELYGFEPLETPALEYFETLTKKGIASEELMQEIYAFEDKSKRMLALRFDLTVPLARVVAMNKQLAMPFKRYQIGNVFRYDRPQAKRYREFTQADADIIGSSSIYSELEIVAMSKNIMDALALDAEMKINSRALLEELAIACGIKKEFVSECFRELDKADKLGWDYVEKALSSLGLSSEFLEIVKNNSIEQVEEKLGSETKALYEIKRFLELLKEFKLNKFAKLDLSLARGLEYYTGIVMEIKLSKGPSIAGGGRYDKLIGLYGREAKAVGISFGVDRILDTLGPKEESIAKVFVFAVQKELYKETFEITQKIRALGIPAELDLAERKISKNLEYANKRKIPFVAIIGKKELAKGAFKLRNMETGEERLIELSKLEKLREIL